MKVFGFDEELKLFPQDMSCEQFAWSGIHPYRIDLLEPNAVMQDCEGRMLKYTPLRDLALAFRSSGGKLIVAVHDGRSTWCVEGEDEVMTERTLILRKYRLIARPFQDCLREYFAAMCSGDKLPEPFLRTVVSSCVLMNGTEIQVHFGDKVLYNFAGKAYPRTYFVMHPTYEGVMWEEQRVGMQLPDELRWLFDELPWHDQMVCGAAVRNAFLRRPISEVDVYAESGFASAIVKRYPDFFKVKRNSGWLNGVEYHIRSIRPWPRVPMERMWNWKNLTSADVFYCTNASELCGPRIAFFDEGSKQARFLNKIEPIVESVLVEHGNIKYGLELGGYECIDFPSDCPELRKAQSDLRKRNAK